MENDKNAGGSQGELEDANDTVDESEEVGPTFITERTVDVGPDGKRRELVRRRIVNGSPEHGNR